MSNVRTSKFPRTSLPSLRLSSVGMMRRFKRPRRLRQFVALALTLVLISAQLPHPSAPLPSAQAQTVFTCHGQSRIFQGCPLGTTGYEVDLENQVIDALLMLHRLPPADKSRVLGWERNLVRAGLYDELLGVIDKAPVARTADEQNALDVIAAGAAVRGPPAGPVKGGLGRLARRLRKPG